LRREIYVKQSPFTALVAASTVGRVNHISRVARGSPIRLNVTLDAEHAAKLARLAERMHTHKGTLARSLLTHALDEADPDPRHAADLLDGIPGAYERALVGREQIKAEKTVPLDNL
jgi:hypothetical protein